MKRRWLQYSLRTLFLLTLVVSLAASWVGVQLQRARRQEQALEVLRALGVHVGVRKSPKRIDRLFGIEQVVPALYLVLENPTAEQLATLSTVSCEPVERELRVFLTMTDPDFRSLPRIPGRCSLFLRGAIDDAWLQEVSRHENVTGLHVRAYDVSRSFLITDEGVSYLTRLPHLEWLSINGLEWLSTDGTVHHGIVNIGDEGCRHVSRIRSLRHLRIIVSRGYPGISDAGLKSISTLPNLEELHLSRFSRITERGLDCMKDLKHLRQLGLGAPPVTFTPKDLQRLKERLRHRKRL
jgi:hypothetical protein